MTDATPAAPAQPPAAATAEPGAETAKGERVGTILMVVGIAAVAVLVLDVALKGKLLAPLFALLPAPKPPATEEPGAPPRPE